MVTKMDRDAAKAIRVALDPALAAVAEKLGLTGRSLNASYDPTSGKVVFKVEFALADSGKRTWDAYCAIFGLTPEMFGKTFRGKSGLFTICGLDLKKREFAVQAKDESGRMFGFKAEGVAKTLAAQEAK